MSTPTKEQIAAARDSGFRNSLTHLPKDRVDRMQKAYNTQVCRREGHLERFRKSVGSGK